MTLWAIVSVLLSCNREHPPRLITSEVVEITANSAICGGTIIYDGSGEVVEKGVCWSMDIEPTLSNEKTSDGSGLESFVSQLAGLNENSTYSVRAYAIVGTEIYYGNERIFTTNAGSASNGTQIIADHTIVDDFDKIPAYYMAEVKKMMIYIAGASHSASYRSGLTLLQELYPAYSVNVSNNETYTSSYLRANTGSEYMQEGPWFGWLAYPVSSRPSWSNTVENIIQGYHNNNRNLRVIGFGWCWDMAGGYPSTGWDPVYGCRWWGSSVDGPDGDMGWGLDASDYTVTGNRVSLQTYLDAVEYYRSFCKTHNITETEVIYTTAPLVTAALGAEACWSGQVKHDAMRSWVSSNDQRILLDYADILAYDNNGTQHTNTYDGHTYQVIAPSNLLPEQTGHISNVGAVRLAKAQWWLLARIAGWNGN
ncbi:MAG: hypothetical protein IH591_01515 [Bacteroidales bacterium]|nr:hypothetical protein [Bacteroidales bacterium]